MALDADGSRPGVPGDRFPRLRQTVLDTTDVRLLAEFYRQLLGLRYRGGDEPRPGEADRADGGDGPDWLVLVTTTGERRLAFQRVEQLTRTSWPAPDVPMQLHLDLTVPDRPELEHQRARAEELGAQLLLDRSDDQEEPLYVFADPAGHPFCIFVG